MSPEGVCELNPHMAQSAESYDAHLLACGHAPMVQWRVGGDAGAKQGRGARRVEIRGNLQDKSLIDDNAVGVAAIGDAAGVLVGGVVGKGGIGAELLQGQLTLTADPAGVDQASDGGQVTGLELGYGGTGFSDAPQNLVAGNARVDGGHGTPLIANLVEVGVANSAEENLDLYVVRGWIAPRDGSGRNRRCLAGGGVGFRVVHRSNVGCSPGWRYAEHAILYAECARGWSLAHRERPHCMEEARHSA